MGLAGTTWPTPRAHVESVSSSTLDVNVHLLVLNNLLNLEATFFASLHANCCANLDIVLTVLP